MRLVVSALAIMSVGAVAASGCRRDTPASVDASASSAAADADVRSASSATAEVLRSRARVPALAFATVTRSGASAGATGLADVATKRGATGETVFEAASIAKLVVATCVMQLVEERRLDLDANASKYVGFALRHPRFPEPITLRMLLTHRASILDLDDELTARAVGHPLGPFLETYLVRGSAPRAAAFSGERPGSKVAYSNVGASVAALAVERVSGESFATYSARRVLAPLRMSTTTWALPEPAPSSYAPPHALRDGAFVALPAPSHAVYPAVDLFASASDLARLARAILREGELDGARILSASSVRAMLGGDGAEPLGWQARTIGGKSVVGHEGEDAGATTGLFLDLAAGSGAVVLANGDAFGSGDKVRAEAIEAMISGLLATKR